MLQQISKANLIPLIIGMVFTLLIFLPVSNSVAQGSTASPSTMPNDTKTTPSNPYANAEITTRIIPSHNNTYGYDILIYGRPLIHQPSIPGLPGNDGFKTREHAQKVAKVVVKKLRNNEMPPTVSMEEMNQLGVLK